MAHFAKISKATNEVLHVSVVDNWNCVDGEGNEVEAIGVAYLEVFMVFTMMFIGSKQVTTTAFVRTMLAWV